jgi:nucleoside 2-deoxyribosyltransferase
VLSIGCNLRSDHQVWADPAERKAIKVRLDELHLRKIDLADEVLVLNVDGYIGESTRREIDYAVAHGKPVRYLDALATPETGAEK